MMSTGEMSGVVDMLRSMYRHTQTLEEFADAIVFREGQRAALLQHTDTNGFKSFVRDVFVCFDKELQQVASSKQICALSELLAFILNGLHRKRKKNVLVHGYTFLSVAQEERDADNFKLRGHLTQSAAYIHGSDLWKKVCGVPIYDRVSMTTISSWFSLQSPAGTRGNSHFGKHRRALTLQKKKAARTRSSSKKKGRMRCGKRKRGTDQMEEEEDMMCSAGKRRRVGQTEQGCQEISGAAVRSVETPAPSLKAVENTGSGSKCAAEPGAVASEGEPSWRSGLFPPLPPSQCFIRTSGLLYGGKGIQGFLLNRKKKVAEGSRKLQAKDLIRIVFFQGVAHLAGMERKPRKLPQRFFNMVSLFAQLLQQHRRCPYSKIMQRMCPLLDGGGGADMKALVQQHCGPHRVYLFVRECLSSVVPAQLWGSAHNRLQFLSRVRGFLCSGKFERLSVAELLWKMKVNDCDWLKISKTGRCPPSELAHRTRILAQWLAWLLDGFVGGLVRACFYVTESVGHKNALRFYRQEVWTKLQELAFIGHLSKGQMEELSPSQVASLPKTTVVSHLRFTPKADGMRPITRVMGTDAKTRLHRVHTRDLLDVLRACVRAAPSLLGSTVWGMSDIHKVLSSLAPAQRDKPQPLYFVKVDVSGAFESLPHDKLVEVISEALSPVQDERFTVRRYAKIWAGAHEGIRKAFVRQADFQEDNMGSNNMKSFAASLQRSGKVHHAILVEQHFSANLDGREALQFFTKMLSGGVVQFGKKTYRQCRGIPQGSVVSSLLCCLCYGHMENVLLKGITANPGCLMRLVDDFLLITPNLQQAQSFLKILLDGVPQYGVVVNPQKVVVNFQLSESSGPLSPDIRVLPPRCLFPWCGLLLDTHTLSVHKDYSSYAGLSLRYSLTLASVPSAGRQMRRKLMAILRLKCHALFLDLKTNSLEAVYSNVYKLVLLHAFRFHVCAQSLPFGQSVAKNPSFFLQMIWDMAQYTNQLIRLSNKGVTLGSKEQTGVVQYEAIELLFCLCFLLVLSKQRHLYKHLLPHLQKWKRSLEHRLGDLRLARVRQAANPRTPADFLDIRT